MENTELSLVLAVANTKDLALASPPGVQACVTGTKRRRNKVLCRLFGNDLFLDMRDWHGRIYHHWSKRCKIDNKCGHNVFIHRRRCFMGSGDSRNGEVSDLLLAPFRLDLLLNLFLDSFSNFYFWNFLYRHLFLHRMELHSVLCLFNKRRSLISLTGGRNKE